MKTYILTEYERKLIKAYLAHGNKSPQLRTLKMRALENYRTLEEDLDLIKVFLREAGVVIR